MPRKKLSESLTARIFLITAGILLFAGTVTFGLIAWATPSTYTAVVNNDLAAQVDALAERLADTTPEDCGALLDEFTLSSGASAMLVGPDGELVDTGASLTVQAVYEDERVAVTTAEGDTVVSYGTGTETEETMTITASDGATIAAEVTFAGQSESYTLYVTPRIQVENLAVRALVQMAPWILMVLLAFSLPLYAEEGKTSLTIAVGCTGGHHRSVAVTHALAGFIREQGYQALENHRDMMRGG